MKKIIFILIACLSMLTMGVSYVNAQVYDDMYVTYGPDRNVVVVDNVCYVYYANPTVAFLNTLHVINGAYHYWFGTRYIPVVFPRWNAWSPYRYFYFNGGHWMWRDRQPYNHAQYRNTHRWNDYRRTTPPRTTTRPNGNVNGRAATPNRNSSMRGTQHGTTRSSSGGYRSGGGRR